MNREEIRQKAIECGKEMMCSNCRNPCAECEYREYYYCNTVSCFAVYGYEHGFADGVEEGEKQMTGIITRNVIASLEAIEKGYRTLGEYIEQLKGEES